MGKSHCLTSNHGYFTLISFNWEILWFSIFFLSYKIVYLNNYMITNGEKSQNEKRKERTGKRIVLQYLCWCWNFHFDATLKSLLWFQIVGSFSSFVVIAKPLASSGSYLGGFCLKVLISSQWRMLVSFSTMGHIKCSSESQIYSMWMTGCLQLKNDDGVSSFLHFFWCLFCNVVPFVIELEMKGWTIIQMKMNSCWIIIIMTLN